MISLNNAFLRKLHRLLRPDHLKRHIKRGLIVGKNVSIAGDVIIDNSHTWHIEIGDEVTLARRVHILAHDASTKRHLHCTRLGKVRIGNRVFVGAGSIILPGVTIGDNVIVGAGSIVSRDIPDGHVVAGNPARIICTIDEFLDKKRNEMKVYPCFGKEYATERRVTTQMKNEMNTRMKDGIGYIR